jgi:hypothetical protein
MVNLGKKVWVLLEKGKPVVDLKTDTASALPKGVKTWMNLSGWKAPKSHVYRLRVENGFGITVIDYSFRVIYTSGGALNGKGRYLTQVSVIPDSVNVVWGFNLSSEVLVPNVVNVGTVQNPVAGMELLVKWTSKTLTSYVEGSKSFFVQGDGAFFDVSNRH